MSERIHTNSQKTRPYKANIYHEFIAWYSLPHKERVNFGIENQDQFAEIYKVSPNTLSEWKKRPDFERRTDELLMELGKSKTVDVVQGMYMSAVKGNPMSQMLWLQYFKKFNPKAAETQNENKVEITINDIRFLIEALPEPLKKKHYANLRELLDDSAAINTAIDEGEVPDGIRLLAESNRVDGFEDTVPGETDHDAQVVHGQGTNALARRYSERVCDHLERKASSSNHQSAAWRWQE